MAKVTLDITSAFIDSARAIGAAERKNLRVYAAHVETFGVTLETVGAHCSAIASVNFPGVKAVSNSTDPAERARKNMVDRYRLGLKNALGAKPAAKATDWLKLAVSAAENAVVKGELPAADVAKALAKALDALGTAPTV